jgi:hypothetical protein
MGRMWPNRPIGGKERLTNHRKMFAYMRTDADRDVAAAEANVASAVHGQDASVIETALCRLCNRRENQRLQLEKRFLLDVEGIVVMSTGQPHHLSDPERQWNSEPAEMEMYECSKVGRGRASSCSGTATVAAVTAVATVGTQAAASASRAAELPIASVEAPTPAGSGRTSSVGTPASTSVGVAATASLVPAKACSPTSALIGQYTIAPVQAGPIQVGQLNVTRPASLEQGAHLIHDRPFPPSGKTLIELRWEAEIEPMAPVVDERAAEAAASAVAKAPSSRGDPPPATALTQKIPGPPFRFLDDDMRVNKPTASKRASTARPMLSPRTSSFGDAASTAASASAAVFASAYDALLWPKPTRIPPHGMKRRDVVRPEDVRDWRVDENWEIEQKRRLSRNLVLTSLLLGGESVVYRSSGSSLYPLVHYDDLTTYEPVTSADQVVENDIVFCEVQPRGFFYAHLVWSKGGMNHPVSDDGVSKFPTLKDVLMVGVTRSTSTAE